MPLTITKEYEEGRLVSVQTSNGFFYKNYTPDEYINFLENKVHTLEDEFKKNGRIINIFTRGGVRK